MEYLSLRHREFKTTLRVLESYPETRADLKPSEKSRSAAELAMMLVIEEQVITSLIKTGNADTTVWSKDRPASLAGIINAWQTVVAENDRLLQNLLDEDFKKTVKFYGMHLPLQDALWFEMLDHIHHRGQFSVYLRLADAKVPSIYGPSADEPMQTATS